MSSVLPHSVQPQCLLTLLHLCRTWILGSQLCIGSSRWLASVCQRQIFNTHTVQSYVFSISLAQTFACVFCLQPRRLAQAGMQPGLPLLSPEYVLNLVPPFGWLHGSASPPLAQPEPRLQVTCIDFSCSFAVDIGFSSLFLLPPPSSSPPHTPTPTPGSGPRYTSALLSFFSGTMPGCRAFLYWGQSQPSPHSCPTAVDLPAAIQGGDFSGLGWCGLIVPSRDSDFPEQTVTNILYLQSVSRILNNLVMFFFYYYLPLQEEASCFSKKQVHFFLLSVTKHLVFNTMSLANGRRSRPLVSQTSLLHQELLELLVVPLGSVQ